MTAQTARLLVDGNGIVIPNQYYDATSDTYKEGVSIFNSGTAVSSSNPLPVSKISDATATATTGDGTITTGGTSQVLLTAKTRKGYWVQNTSTDYLTINRSGGTASATSFKIAAGGYFWSEPFENVSTKIEIFGLTTGQTFAYGECV